MLWLDILEDEWLSLFSRPYHFAYLMGDAQYLKAMEQTTSDLAERRAFNAANPDHISARPRQMDAPPSPSIEDMSNEELKVLAAFP